MTTFAAAATLRDTAARPHVRGWMLAVAVYFLAVFHRSSLGVAGLLAEQRFGITDAQLGVFVFLQIGVYAAMQIPTGVLVDRYGPRRMLVAAAALMALGQLTFAFAPSYPVALLARVLLGCGDAMTFVSVLRYVAARFSARRYPVLVALTGTVGTVGNLFATLPLAALLHGVGWTAGFGVAGSLSVVSAVAVWLLLDDGAVAAAPAASRARTARRHRRRVAPGRDRVGAARHPGRLLGALRVDVDRTCARHALGRAVPRARGRLLDLGRRRGSDGQRAVRRPRRSAGRLGDRPAREPAGHPGVHRLRTSRSPAGWRSCSSSATLRRRPTSPRCSCSPRSAAPASMVAFALARDYNSPRIIGTASGVVNVGGFVATAIVAMVFGQVLTHARRNVRDDTAVGAARADCGAGLRDACA